MEPTINFRSNWSSELVCIFGMGFVWEHRARITLCALNNMTCGQIETKRNTKAASDAVHNLRQMQHSHKKAVKCCNDADNVKRQHLSANQSDSQIASRMYIQTCKEWARIEAKWKNDSGLETRQGAANAS